MWIKRIKRPWSAPSQATKKHDNFYDSPAWRKVRAHKLKINPMCEYCALKGYHIWARIVDHFRPRSLWPDLSLDITNLRSCCAHCHDRKRNIEMRFKGKEELLNKLKEYGFY